MQAVVYDAPRRFAVQEVPRPVAGAGEVVVDVTLGGVCGTDMHLHEGGFFATFPLTPGHESTGVVRQVGDGVDSRARRAAGRRRQRLSVWSVPTVLAG